MLSAMAIENKESELQRAIEDNHKALFELLDCLGDTGKRRIALSVKEVRDDGQGDTSRL